LVRRRSACGEGQIDEARAIYELGSSAVGGDNPFIWQVNTNGGDPEFVNIASSRSKRTSVDTTYEIGGLVCTGGEAP
jgi:hypothetical protein